MRARSTDSAALEVAAQIAEALAHAHGRGIVHRDVKPSNVLLAQHSDVQSEGIDVRLLDFGLAQMAEFDTLTALGDVPGTLAYISPERLQGLTATEAADVWAVGVLLWEALAGQHPFWGGDLSRHLPPDPAGRAAARDACAPTCPGTCSTRWGARCSSTRSAARPPRSSPASCATCRSEAAGPAGRSRSCRRSRRPRALGERLLPAALTGIASGWVALRLPFYPPGWPLAIAGVGAVLGFGAARAGLLFALAVAFFPLANISLGLAVVYGVVAAAWVALTWKDARAGLLLAAGPLLAPFAALGLIPLAAQLTRGRARRAAQAFAAVLLAALVAGLRKVPLPFDGSTPPLGLGIAGSTRPTAVAQALWSQLAQHPVLTAEARRDRSRGGAPSLRSGTAAPGPPPPSAPRCWPRRRWSRRPPPCCRSSSPPG